MHVQSTEQVQDAALKPSTRKRFSDWASAAFAKLTTKRTGESTNTVATPEPTMSAALPDGHEREHLPASKKIAKALDVSRMHAVSLARGFAKYSCSIIRDPRDLFDESLPDFSGPVREMEAERGREMTVEELQEAGLAYGVDLGVLDMQGMKFMGWVSEYEEAVEAAQFV
ncbi:hypothetical protein V495_06851 [Pseudogymnoascus sp. VKM F-4514 (FW-929)]|nr:hypothetical protein V495_06851 [Pseudogymnoascus sp. VKM F-4514 (FW-929)]KFY51751.1 hypothetical protein V497_08879 [Pseudogymnoascus sp. VKM F-4516 (FW-969)]